MKIEIGKVTVYFPLKYIYSEQYEYLLYLHSIFVKSPTNAVIQVPPTISKSICLFSFYVSSFIQNDTEKPLPKLIFSAKSTPELEHAMTNLKLVISYIKDEYKIEVPLLALGISEKKNLCINEAVSSKFTREAINYECNKRIAPWSREFRKKNRITDTVEELENDPALCYYYEGYIPNYKKVPKKLTGCYSMADLREYGKKNKMCPYYVTEDLFPQAQIILCDYFMLFGMKKSNNYDRKLLDGSFLVIDECCGLDEAISELFTERVSKISLDCSLKCAEDLSSQLKTLKEANPNRYEEEYKKLVQGLSKEDLDPNQINKKNERLANGANNGNMNGNGPEDIDIEKLGEDTETTEKKNKFPGYIRKPEHFLTHLKKFILFLKGSIGKTSPKVTTHSDYLEKYLKESLVDPNMLPIAYFPARMKALINYLQNSEIESDHFLPLHALIQFAQLFGTFAQGFEVILYSIQESYLDVNEASLMVLSLACLDPAGPFHRITSNIGLLVLHTETLSEVDTFAKILDLVEHPNQAKIDSFKVSLSTKLKILPIIVTKGADQIELSTEHARRHDAGVMRNYSNMIVRLSEAVPDGILCMFPNSRSLKDIGLDFYDDILAKKLIFAESLDVAETSKSVSGYIQACDTGRGGVFMGLLRGNVIGQITFDNRYAKCVIIFGVPLEFQRPREFLARTIYFKNKKLIPESDYVVYSSMKEVNKALGKIIQKRDDACVVIFADKRFLQADKIARLPDWIRKSLDNINKGVPSDQASYRAARFYKGSDFDKEWKRYSESDMESLKELFEREMYI